ncbi:MAG TPA: hypothetical protein VMV45_21590 [Casimicrobiaceae bacterium]|nr:hypothetical protein [Casimicrobiaceae bacterium]
MHEQQRQQPDVVPNPHDSAEAKRLAARRRFLTGTAGGSSLLIVTLCHQRALANPPGGGAGGVRGPQPGGNSSQPDTTSSTYEPRGVLVSSELVCASLHGQSYKNVAVLNSVTGQLVTRVDCIRN